MTLTKTQRALLSSAAQHDDQLVVLPETLKGGAAKATLSKLLSLGLVAEMMVTAGEPHWRKDENNHPIGLRITQAGLVAIGIEPEDPCGEEADASGEDPNAPVQHDDHPERSGEGSGPPRSWAPREGRNRRSFSRS